MTSTDAARSEQAQAAARVRWRQQGDPVLSRSVQVVVERHADLNDAQRAAVEAAITDSPADGDGE
jgi:hypothetical protein